jgi:hypothetical protein
MLRQDVNFFGHAAVASWSSEAPGTALGAMLPDFATMAGIRIASSADADVTAGIALHHATDAAFHTLPLVLDLMRELDALLDRAGCARGPRRAVSHIGIELLLDGILVDDPTYRDVYVRGLHHDDPTLAFRPDPTDAPTRFARLLARLRSYGVPDDLKSPLAITQRLARMLAHRPLLAPSPADLETFTPALGAMRARVNGDGLKIINLLRGSTRIH